jgi:hypothetical protein
VTNIHTHGLHVNPGPNGDGTHSDNIFLRVIPTADAEKIAENPNCALPSREGDDLINTEADYEFVLGNVMGDPNQLHPPGTFWYHPHSHGATHNQVASGMAGFLIVDGDVDEAINEQLAGIPDPDPTRRTGDWNYRERLMLIQRVNVSAVDPDAPPKNTTPKQSTQTFLTVNGSNSPRFIVMQPGAIERWRILNGSVDGKGYVNFMVLKGRFEYDDKNNVLVSVTYDEDGQVTRTPFTQSPANQKKFEEELKQHLWLLAWDGITLVRQNEDGTVENYVKDLNFEAADNPRDILDPMGKQDPGVCYQDADSIKACYIRPNELDLAPANRADVFFQAPALEEVDTQIYTVIARGTPLHTDGAPAQDTIVAYLIVRGEPVAGASDYNFSEVLELPPVQPYLLPICPAEMSVTDPLPPEKACQDDNPVGPFRTRAVTYSGWGAGDFPIIEVPDEHVEQNYDLQKLQFYKAPKSIKMPATDPLKLADGTEITEINNLRRMVGAEEVPMPTVLLPPNTRTMAIRATPTSPFGGETPIPPRKFDPTLHQPYPGDDHYTPKMLLDTAEEWVIFNNSVTLWGPKPPTEYDPATSEDVLWYVADEVTEPQLYWPGHVKAHPSRQVPAAPNNNIVTKGADHPFHIHQNPFWLIRVEVPDANGNLVNILPEPRWQDSIWIPRNGGRVVFRARYPDFDGQWVNHCHLLLHEDNGMMQQVNVVTEESETNYHPSDQVASFEMQAEEVNEIYHPPTLEEAWLDSYRFVDPTPTGQVFPGFEASPPDS